MIKLLVAAFAVFSCSMSYAGILKDFDSLGGNDVLIKRAKELQPEKDIKIVQNRIVARRWRNEFSPTYTNVIGGDAYLETQTLGLDYHLHINHNWAVGLSYFQASNDLSSEGRYLIDSDGLVPDVDQPENGTEFLVNFSPIYGKINMFDMGVLHFDVYALGTYGQIKLKSGGTETYSFGAGFGLWISQYITSRFELRQRYYESKRFGGNTGVEATLASFSLGVMI